MSLNESASFSRVETPPLSAFQRVGAPPSETAFHVWVHHRLGLFTCGCHTVVSYLEHGLALLALCTLWALWVVACGLLLVVRTRVTIIPNV